MKNIVTVGGGTGSYTVLSGLKNVPNISISALVSMSDDGGSTGVLRDELGVLPPGDVRQCLVALSEHSDIVRKLMNYRFSEGTLSGHNFGNIFLAALEKVTGDFVHGVEVASGILKVKGSVVPVTADKAELVVELADGAKVEGQAAITETNILERGLRRIFYKNPVKLTEKAEQAILNSDYIIIGPGDFYSSIVPNLIVEGFGKAIGASRAKIIMPVNLTNKQEHTKNWKTSDYLKNVEKYLGKEVDFILVNNEPPSKEQIERYKLEEGDGVLVEDDLGNDPRVIRQSLLSHAIVLEAKADKVKRSFIRHDSLKTAKCIEDIIQ